MLIINVIVLIGGRPCRYWCRTKVNSFYCCPSGRPADDQADEYNSWPNYPVFFMGVFKSFEWHLPFFELGHSSHENNIKKCPPTRDNCPRSFYWSDSPEICGQDGHCGSDEKCCYDICIEEKICKPSE